MLTHRHTQWALLPACTPPEHSCKHYGVLRRHAEQRGGGEEMHGAGGAGQHAARVCVVAGCWCGVMAGGGLRVVFVLFGKLEFFS